MAVPVSPSFAIVYCLTALILLPTVIPTVYTVRLLCQFSCFLIPLMLAFCPLHTALPVRLPANLTLLLYFRAGCRSHPTLRLSYLLATDFTTMMLLATVTWLSQLHLVLPLSIVWPLSCYFPLSYLQHILSGYFATCHASLYRSS